MRALQPGTIGGLRIPNRIVRAATSEARGGPGGEVTPEAIEFYRRLGAGGAGLVITGHIYVHPRGRHHGLQTGIHHDGLIEGHARLTEAVHREGGLIFAELGHVGSQTMIPEIAPLAPSAVTNPMTGITASEMTEADLAEVIDAFGAARAGPRPPATTASSCWGQAATCSASRCRPIPTSAATAGAAMQHGAPGW
ncbi:NADH oxidase [Methylobrevis pamukkalensis]|uniref:NADH oxidase n=1 Tax=Methylobrevis pamukkalensis TaxID=1439726 RepID=A0A1E3H562_9HYPH|nr:NADH oxidase [Methylobrevis pamukkalensis]